MTNQHSPRIPSHTDGPSRMVSYLLAEQSRLHFSDELLLTYKINKITTREDGFGVLVISSVETDDSGTYVCTVTAGSFQVL